ncbi:hypothetical protein [Longispora albida]|uniref:hypothetical protein n=1 Tax=Longispora albida TaxID=203523 RepID=UPI00038114FA|nr:hypothetical protein [Longispora albida]
MFRKIATVALTSGLLALSPAGPAHAATVDLTFGPLSIGDYCRAKVATSAFIGFHEGSLRCYTYGAGTSLQYVGTGDAYLACKYLTTDVVSAALRGPSGSLVCRVIR